MNLNVSSLYSRAALLAILMPASVAAAPEAAVLARPALKAERLHSRSFLALASAGKRLVAVGERGLIALSDDHGASWRQASTPVSITLTCVSFVDARLGWAAGHAGAILHTADGGATWTLQTDGRAVARQIQTSVSDVSAGTAAAGMAAVAAQLVADGPDKPFLDIQFSDARHGVAVGAYGLAVKTDDGGRTWQSFMHQVPNPKGLHLYAVRMAGDSVWLAGEQGYLARSAGAGHDFQRIETPYRGSYFALAANGNGVVVAGLKGNAFQVSPDGVAFSRIEGAPPVSFSSVTKLRDGRLAFTNQAGQVLLAPHLGARLTILPAGPRAPLSAVAESADGRLVLAGAAGLERMAPDVAKTGGRQ
ncbi:YCF48-related protein [Telluria mixta]|uniref:YCF48-related protein n=1 Tax=Telluria mixta TaxID=34071 RepID=A0ABT2BTU5_9BURK|nr:YCF48-related protein [Telluria mixta]MCS0627889.1 YCF48-related protein [Telluria mixta]WEM93992.1 YCF48-related protein [Telluria mixta]